MKLRLDRKTSLRAVLVAALLGVGAEALLGRAPEAADTVAAVVPAKRSSAPAAPVPEAASIDLDALPRPVSADVKDDLFYIPPPPAPPPPPRTAAKQAETPPPPPKPTAPPLPFKFLGRLVDKGSTVVFVSHNGVGLNLRQGDVAGDVYRVERITPTEVVFLYEPLGEKQVLQLEAIN